MTELSYCVVNTGGRDYLLDCLAAIERTARPGDPGMVIVLANLADAYARAGDRKYAMALRKRAREIEEQVPPTRVARGQARDR